MLGARVGVGAGAGAGALSHVKVLDLSRVLAAPWTTQTLADLGAEVIKVEKPGTGDDTRSWGPPFLRRAKDGTESKEAAYFQCANRGKKSVAIDFTKPKGQKLVQDLASRADVLVENFKVGGLAKYGLDYASLRALNPGLIYCSVTGFGQTGPRQHQAGYDFVVQGLSGLMSVTGHPQLPPVKVGVAVSDLFTGLYSTIAILAALIHRDRTTATGSPTPVGQHIDMALFDCQVAAMANQASSYLTTGKPPTRLGNSHPSIAPYDVVTCSDGYFILGVGNNLQFNKACQVLGEPSLESDPRFSTNRSRVEHRQELLSLINSHLSKNTKAHWIQRFHEAGVPCEPVNDLREALEDAQLAARKMLVTLPHPISGTVNLVGSPINMSETPVTYQRAPPLLGQHTQEVLRDSLGLSLEAIQSLESEEIIETATPSSESRQ